MLNSNDLGALKALNETAMGDRCTIQRSALVADDTGGHTESKTTVTSSAACRIRKANREPMSKIVAEQFGVLAVYEVVFPAGLDVRPDDWLTISPFQAPGTTREMIVRAPIQSTYETGKVCICTEVL